MRGLDWSNTAYVRLYRQDTATWKRLKWEAQAVYVLLQRHLDRAGCLPLEGLFAYEVVAEMTGVPEEICEQALQRLLAGGFVEISHDALVDPEFLEREEATMSDAQRKRESRQRRRDSARTSRTVTVESRNVTEPSRVVTDGHEASRAVTPCLSLLGCAFPEEEDSLGLAADRASEPPEVVAWITVVGGKSASANGRVREAGGGLEYAVTAEDLAPLAEAYPGVDVKAEVMKARAWAVSNPTKRKTPAGMPKFLNGWMSKAQNDGRRSGPQPSPGRGSGKGSTALLYTGGFDHLKENGE